MFTPAQKPSTDLISSAKQFGIHNGPGFDIEKPLFARVKAELDAFFIQVKGRFEALRHERAVLLDREADFKAQLEQKRALRSEFPISKTFFWFLVCVATMGAFGELTFIAETVGNGTDLNAYHSYGVAMAILAALFTLKWFLGKWFMNKSLLASSEKMYPKKAVAVIGGIVSTILIAMYVGIGLFRAEVLSWTSDEQTFGLFMQHHRGLALFILGVITAGMFVGITFLMGIIDAMRNVLAIDAKIKKLQYGQEYLIKSLTEKSTEFYQLEELVHHQEQIKQNMLQSWLVDAHLAYMDGCAVFMQEQEKAMMNRLAIGQQQQQQVLPQGEVGEYSGMSLSDIAQFMMEEELNEQMLALQQAKKPADSPIRFTPINYKNGFANQSL